MKSARGKVLRQSAEVAEAAVRPPLAAHWIAPILLEAYGHLDGFQLLSAMIKLEFQGRIVVVSSFGVESALILDLVARVDPTTPVIFLDTEKHFEETLAYRDELTNHLGLTDVRSVQPDAADLAKRDPHDRLWRCDPDLCCYLRKTLPLERALGQFDAWVTGRKRRHGGTRANLPTIEAADGRIKINPLARWTAGQAHAAFARRNLPSHPRAEDGYPSIGCEPCTAKVRPGEPVRGGRWPGTAKTECGIHGGGWVAE